MDVKAKPVRDLEYTIVLNEKEKNFLMSILYYTDSVSKIVDASSDYRKEISRFMAELHSEISRSKKEA